MTPFAITLAEWRLGLLRGDQMPPRAAEALESGLDSPHLRVLASLIRPTADEANPYVIAAATELGLTMPDGREATLAIARSVARDILSGSTAPYAGACRIWSLWNEDFPDELLAFVGEASQMDDFLTARPADPSRYDALIARCEEGIRDAAKAIVGQVAA